MSRVFYDHLIIVEEIDILIKRVSETQEEKEELWRLVDEILHARVIEIIFDKLPQEFHGEFLEMFSQAPHDERHIKYLNDKIPEDVENIIKVEVDKFKNELLSLIEEDVKK